MEEKKPATKGNLQKSPVNPEANSPAEDFTLPVSSMLRRDDNFELFLNNGGMFDAFVDSNPSDLSFHESWHDDGW